MAREFNTVGVVGLGTMGAGIVEVFARNGVDVVAVEVDGAALDKGRVNLTASTDRAVARGKLDPADRDALHARVTFAVGLDALRDVDLAVEAVPERLDLKRRLLAELDRVCPPGAVLATNTSSLSVTEIAVATERPGQVIGLHFFNPAPVMRLVEVISTVVTAPEVARDVQSLCARLGKVGVSVTDRAGFIANALLFGYLNQAVGMYEAGYASREDIDAAMQQGHGLPMGPLTLLDLIGLDTAYQVLETMYQRGGHDRRHAAAPLLRQMVTAGLLGRKSGRGFYTYQAPGSSRLAPDDLSPVAGAEAAEPAPRTVGVVGSGSAATDVADVLTAAGVDVVAVADPGGVPAADHHHQAVRDLAAVDLVVVVGPSTAPVIDVAMATGRPADVVGLHFVGGTAARARLVEVVRTVRTSPSAVRAAHQLCAALGRTAVTCGDRAGFIADALLVPYLNDAVRMLESNYSTADDIDAAMKLGCGYPAGPFELLDTVGLDVALAVQTAIHRELPEPGLAPAPLLRNLVTAGRLGRRTGGGFRDHAG
ncbi:MULTISPECIES: 3-hydroxyacyl-CoA dehydrogenase family protein [Micromonosporaceae]|uniref:3-hydroxyacyl-CoA dehydrogenase family protein n=1 Tax=Micromonosporaceae TaxID=28056 RepID=UPI00248C5634|nr:MULTISPECIES: 3-hydroxyacyl-CoA dehydrogenase [unclassified Solwaraspora]WBB95767.1 3-hydroxybutyryl-CoA dehydrogenase [Solwaraspora sp. WMMA2059]WBC20329.1 3-hydroxybutyryl-CoA dehydrogenase [Solwaraspora sp. WMMA2080]WJK37520.1 3-hydroxybutyryl-CoA dehydrogenase [Solwaraspora sp. WMMA2065]